MTKSVPNAETIFQKPEKEDEVSESQSENL